MKPIVNFNPQRNSPTICQRGPRGGALLLGLRRTGRGVRAIGLVLCALSTIVFADPPLPPPPGLRSRIDPVSQSFDTGQSLPENYIVTLTTTDKDEVVSELALVVATTEFSTIFPSVKSNVESFGGSLSLEQGGDIVLRYVLTGELLVSAPNQGAPNQGPVQYRSLQTRASVRLRPGESVQILKCDTHACRISITRLSDQKGKEK
jgi:hypothetical protein